MWLKKIPDKKEFTDAFAMIESSEIDTVIDDSTGQTCTDSHFFRFPIHHDSFDWYWIQLFDDSFTNKIL